MSVIDTNKYELYQKKVSYDNGATWELMNEYSYVDLGESDECKSTQCETIITWSDGTTSAYTLTEIPNHWLETTDVSILNIGTCVTSIGGSAFWSCGWLTSVTIPDSVTSIGSEAFEGCINLTSITIPDSVTSIGGRAFYICTGLTSVIIGSGVTSIDFEVFQDCTSLTSITIPDSVTSIGNYAFASCTSITSVTIGSGVTSIGNSAFASCESLSLIIYNGSKAQWNAISKGIRWKLGVLTTCIVHCTDGDIPISEA